MTRDFEHDDVPIPVEIAATLQALYECISFEEDSSPDWERLRSLFAPHARLVHAPADGAVSMDLETFISRFKSQIETGNLTFFKEIEITARVEVFGNIAHIFSTFESQFTPDESVPTDRGVNSIQMVFFDGRWLVTSIVWEDETDQYPLPARYLP